MDYLIFGLGNPGDAYAGTRHNSGRAIVRAWQRKLSLSDWRKHAASVSLQTQGKIGRHQVILVLPETMMNHSGLSVAKLIKSKKAVGNLIVVHDDIDLPLGRIKLSFNRGSGGHRGVESIIKSLNTKAFMRLRIGIAPVLKSGRAKVFTDGAQIVKHVLGKFSPKEQDLFRRVQKKAQAALDAVLSHGLEKAMSLINR